MMDERRLGDRILHALELAIEEGDLEVSEHLARALEETLTRFGGPGRRERRDLPAGMLDAFDRLDRLRHPERGDAPAAAAATVGGGTSS